MFCNHCGYQLPEGSNFCNNCGKPVSMNPGSQPDGQPQPMYYGYQQMQVKTVVPMKWERLSIGIFSILAAAYFMLRAYSVELLGSLIGIEAIGEWGMIIAGVMMAAGVLAALTYKTESDSMISLVAGLYIIAAALAFWLRIFFWIVGVINVIFAIIFLYTSSKTRKVIVPLPPVNMENKNDIPEENQEN